ncbi:MAG TPA: hypothetical protein VMV18_14410 [bacterium]|nr:hypothetical protein [bacterium]
MRVFVAAVVAVVVALVATACGPGTPRGAGASEEGVCVSGKYWRGGAPSAEMHPGGDCIGCHARSGGSAPSFVIAGTVYPNLDAPMDCDGVAGATVTLTDAAGKVWGLYTNEAGNFALAAKDAPDFVFPFRAQITYQGQTNEMDPAQGNGSCNACHTLDGENGAPGRAVIAGGEVRLGG